MLKIAIKCVELRHCEKKTLIDTAFVLQLDCRRNPPSDKGTGGSSQMDIVRGTILKDDGRIRWNATRVNELTTCKGAKDFDLITPFNVIMYIFIFVCLDH